MVGGPEQDPARPRDRLARPSLDAAEPRNTLQNAIDRFYEAITTMNMIPGAINLSSYEETFGSIKVGDIIDATKNNSGIIYKVRPRTDGIYIPSISASTNTEAADNPRVNISVSSDLEILKEQTVDPDNSVLVEKGANGWNTFKTYKFPETAPLSANQDYYILLRFLISAQWCSFGKLIGLKSIPSVSPFFYKNGIIRIHSLFF